MSEGSDNPILDMGLLQMFQPNKYINPKYKDNPLDLPGFYTGVAGAQGPTDAMGRPIQSFVDANNTAQADYQKQLAAYNADSGAKGTTLTSTPQQISDLQAQINQGTINAANATQTNNTGTFGNVNTGIANYPGAVDAIQGLANYKSQANQDYAAGLPIGMPQQQQSGQGAPPTPPDMRQAYLDALANPGKVTTPGANVAASNPLGQPSVLSAFMDAHPGGVGTNKGFFDTLDKLRSTA
jgi:hypothetical protein